MRKLTVMALATLAAAVAGCASSVKSTEPQTFTYDCSGLGKGWGDCNEKADAQCGAHNYTVVSQKGDAEGKSASGNSEMRRTLVVTCKH